MPKQRTGMAEYARRLNEETERFTEELLGENDRLRKVNDELQLEADNLRERLALAESESRRELPEAEATAEEQWGEMESERGDFLKEYQVLRRQNTNLVNLYVSSFQLHGTLDRQEILATIVEIIVNLVGSEELAVFELDRESSSLRLVTSMGIDESRYRSIPLDSGLIARVAQTGELHVSAQDAEGGEDGITACVPLSVGSEVKWVIAIFSLLPQKPGVETIDHELFELLATQAGMALYCTELHLEREGAIQRAS